MRRLISILLVLTFATQLAAKPPLREVAEIDDGLMVIAIADELRKSCDGIDARLIRAVAEISQLRSRARDLGYSNSEIDDYVNSGSEKARMRDKANAFLASRGVSTADQGQFCAFGRSEIAANSAIGRLLR